MPAQYLIRFDDICPTMRWDMWDAIEEALDHRDAKPILAVVPDNQDAELRLEPARTDFWERVRAWQAKGWTIGLHGYQHKYVNRDPGLMGISRNSEFAGLPRGEQRAKLDAALAIFARERVRPELWIAPSHSFDETTLDLLAGMGMDTVSDGFAFHPWVDARGLLWIPQQMWRFRPLPFGAWTVCYHHNRWRAAELDRFRRDLETYAGRITGACAVQAGYAGRRRSWADTLAAKTFLKLLAAKRAAQGKLGFSPI